MENKKMKKVFSGILVGGMILTLGTISLAATNANLSPFIRGNMQGQERNFGGHGQDKGVVITDALSALKEKGIITQDQITKYQENSEEIVTSREQVKNIRQGKGRNMQNKFAQNGGACLEDSQDIFTDEQVDEIREKVQELNRQGREEAVSASLDTLVSDNTITKDQKLKFLEYIEVNQAQREADRDKIEGMTVTEAREYMKTTKHSMVNPITKLVDDEIITQEQADIISQTLPKAGNKQKNGSFNHNGSKGNYKGGMRGTQR